VGERLSNKHDFRIKEKNRRSKKLFFQGMQNRQYHVQFEVVIELKLFIMISVCSNSPNSQ
jgi:hypothetical protein